MESELSFAVHVESAKESPTCAPDSGPRWPQSMSAPPSIINAPNTTFHKLYHWPLAYFRKWRGQGHGLFPPMPPVSVMISTYVGCFLGIASLGLLAHTSQFLSHSLIASFGASAVLLYGSIDSALSQPRNAIIGHLLSAVIGVSIAKLGSVAGGDDAFKWLWGGISVATATLVMQLTKTVHPPGGATALIAVINGPDITNLGYMYVITPIMIGIAVTLLVALTVNNVVRNYPMYWLQPNREDSPEGSEMQLNADGWTL